jgi:hypothetical protein
MTLRSTFGTVAVLMAGWAVYHLSIYRYGYEKLGTNDPARARREIVVVERATGDACVWRWSRGWVCVDAEIWARVEREGLTALPSGPPYGAPRAGTGLRHLPSN